MESATNSQLPDRGITPGLGVLDYARLLGAIVAAVPPTYQVAPRTLLGLVSYWAGDGALCDRHCEEALRIGPTYTFAAQIRALQALGVPPGWVQLSAALENWTVSVVKSEHSTIGE